MFSLYAKFSKENPFTHKVILAIYMITLLVVLYISLHKENFYALSLAVLGCFGLFFFAKASQIKRKFP